MLLAVLIAGCSGCDGVPLLGYLRTLTQWDNGIIIVATLLMFPTSLLCYGGMIVFYAAKEFVEKRAMKRGRDQERERIRREFRKLGTPLTPEQARILDSESGADEAE